VSVVGSVTRAMAKADRFAGGEDVWALEGRILHLGLVSLFLGFAF
jgi:hypothetical protein